MSTKITHEYVIDMLDRTTVDDILQEMKYNPERNTEAVVLDGIDFNSLARAAHNMDITVNAMVNALLYLHIKEWKENPPSIPGVGSAPYMVEYWDIDLPNKK